LVKMLITDTKDILEAMAMRPDMVYRLWLEAGHETKNSDSIKMAKGLGIPFKILPNRVFRARFKQIKTHICLEMAEIPYKDPGEFLSELRSLDAPFVCAFDGIYDPQNLGNIIRSAATFAIDGIIIPKDRSCGINETVKTISKGGIEHITVVRVVNLSRYMEDLKNIGLVCYGLDERAERPINEIDLTSPICLVFGREDGLRRLTRERCDMMVRIPTSSDFPSLNLANAFAVASYEIRRQKGYLLQAGFLHIRKSCHR
jgi:23S rRNA (guanosine2251-2'-O)-methyltransferase